MIEHLIINILYNKKTRETLDQECKTVLHEGTTQNQPPRNELQRLKKVEIIFIRN